jgi:hypothetical protein
MRYLKPKTSFSDPLMNTDVDFGPKKHDLTPILAICATKSWQEKQISWQHFLLSLPILSALIHLGGSHSKVTLAQLPIVLI